MKKAAIFLVCCFLVSHCMAQQVVFTIPKKQIVQPKPVGTIPVSFTVINCNPARIQGISHVNTYSGKAKGDLFQTGGFAFTPGYPNGTLNLVFSRPLTANEDGYTIILRFRLDLSGPDTTIFNYDTITIITATNSKWEADKKNTFKIEFSQFTDFLGFDNQKPNGLLQEEFTLKVPIARRRCAIGKTKLHYQPFRSIVFSALFNRIDKSKEYQYYPAGTSLPNNINQKDSIRPFLTTLDIFKYSNLQLGLNFNIVTLHTGRFRFNFDYEFTILRNRPYYADTLKINGSTFTKTDLRPIYSYAHKFEVYGNSADLIEKEYGLAINAGVMLIRLKDGYFKQFDAAAIDPFDRATILLPANDAVIKRKSKPVWFFTGTLKKLWGDDKKNTAFFRLSYYYQTGKFRRYGGDPNITPGNFNPANFYTQQFHNHFLQLQLGVALDMNKFLGIK